MGATDGERRRDPPAGVGRAVVVGDADELVLDAAGIREDEHLLPEPFPLRVLVAGIAQVIPPEPEAGLGHREADRGDLPAAQLADPAALAHREAGEDRALIAVIVGVVEVVDRHGAVVERRLLDAFQAEDLRVEVEVLLRIARAHGQMVVLLDSSGGVHGSTPRFPWFLSW